MKEKTNRVQVKENKVILKNKEKTRTIEWINKGLLRIYEEKNSEELVELSYQREPVAFEVLFGESNTELVDNRKQTADEGLQKSLKERAEHICVIKFLNYRMFVDENLTIRMTKDGKPYFEEYFGKDTVVYRKDMNFDLAMLEGHKDAEVLEDFKTQLNFRLFDDGDKVYGLGDKAAFLNRRDYEYISWNTDDPSEHNETYKSLYKSINYVLINHHESEYYGIFYPSSYKCVFNMGRYDKKFFYIGSKKGESDYFLLIGENPREITSTYSALVGRALYTPMKFLGYHQSRWSYTEKEMEEIRAKKKELGIPLDYIHMDIDYMDHYKVYTVSSDYISDMKTMAKRYAKDGIGLITIIDPAVKLEQGYPLYDELTAMRGFATMEGKDYVNAVWPGDSKYPNYFEEKVSKHLTEVTRKFLEEYGVAGIWCDMNEPASFNGPLPETVEFPVGDKVYYHDEVHNLYGEAMSRCIANAFMEQNKRPVVITRAAFATTSKYTTSWNGDNQSLWEHLAVSLPQVMTMNLCNFTINGVDIGGFGNETTKELVIRWVEANLFSPFFRNHSCKNSRYQEPYAFDEETMQIYRSFVKLRYDFIPYLYDLMWNAHREGIPMYRPLFYDYPTDERTKECNDEVMVGDNILFAPIVHQGERSRIVYFPEGVWIDYLTGKRYVGKTQEIVSMPLDMTGLFIKEGTITPMARDLMQIDKKTMTELHLYLAGNPARAEYVHHEDDGETLDYEKGVYNEYKIVWENGELRIENLHEGYQTTYQRLLLHQDGGTIEVPFEADLRIAL